jgi:hypothetical protein
MFAFGERSLVARRITTSLRDKLMEEKRLVSLALTLRPKE